MHVCNTAQITMKLKNDKNIEKKSDESDDDNDDDIDLNDVMN